MNKISKTKLIRIVIAVVVGLFGYGMIWYHTNVWVVIGLVLVITVNNIERSNQGM